MSLKTKDRTEKNLIIDEWHRFSILQDSREIFIHGYIGDTDEDPGVEYRMANIAVRNILFLERLDPGKPIIIHHHSVGGEWCEGMMMYDVISNSSCPTISITHGVAASMGSIVPLGADLVVTMPYCWWMIHDGNTDIGNHTYKQSVSWAEWEKITQRQMKDIYLMHCKRAEIFKGDTDKKIENFLTRKLDKKEDWWLGAEEAVEYGFADGVYGHKGYSTIEEIIKHVL